MSVYFARVGQYLKVGYSEDPDRRVARLFSSSTTGGAPWDCPRDKASRRMIGYVAGGLGDERIAHLALDEFAVGCEFFLAEPEAIEYVDRCVLEGRVVVPAIERPAGVAALVGQVQPDPNAEAKLLSAALARMDDLFRAASARSA